MIRVDISPEMLRWARERARVTKEDLPKGLHRLLKWESGDIEIPPTLKQLEKFARAVHVPISYLFLSKPPEETLPILGLPYFWKSKNFEAQSQPAGYDLRLSRASTLVSRFCPHLW